MTGWCVPSATEILLAWMFALIIFGAGHLAINFIAPVNNGRKRLALEFKVLLFSHYSMPNILLGSQCIRSMAVRFAATQLCSADPALHNEGAQPQCKRNAAAAAVVVC